MRAEGISKADAFTGKPDSVVGQEVSERYFPAGGGDPLVIISDRAQAEEVGRVVAETRGVVPESLGLPPGTKPEHNGMVLFEATMSDPADSEAAKETVERVRDAVHEVPDADAQVGGGTAALLDMDKATTHDNILIIPLVLVVVLLILGALLRVLIAPLLLIATVVLFLHRRAGHQCARVPVRLRLRGRVDGLPTVRLRVPGGAGHRLQHLPDHPHPRGGGPPGHASGCGDGPGGDGAVITSAGLVLAGTFAALGTLPMVAFAEIGFAVALGVLLDTFVVRSVLVTALFLDVGPKVWWPHRLARENGGAPAREPAAKVTQSGG